MSRGSIFYTLTGFFLSAALFLGEPAAGFLYDDFSGSRVDPGKWVSLQTGFTEIVREVAGGRLIAKVANRPERLLARNDTTFKATASIQTLQCDVIIAEAVLDTGEDPEAFARVSGFFYNSLTAGGAAGDIWAGVHIGNRGSGLEAWWEVSRVLKDDFSDIEVLATGPVATGPLAYGAAYTLKLAYDGANTFTFTVAGAGAVYAAAPARKRPPVSVFKGLSAGVYGFAGASGGGYVSAAFDNVHLNDSPAPFDTFDAELDSSRWASPETATELEVGRLRLNQQGFNAQSQVSAYLSDPDAALVEATVRILGTSRLSPGANGIIRIQGYYYNEYRGPGSGLPHNGYQGDVFAAVRLELKDDGTLKAVAYVGRSDNANESAWSDIATHFFSASIALDTDYRLSIEYRGSALVFKCDDETYTYPIATAQYTPYGQHRALRTRLHLDPGESGYLRAAADDVFVDQCQYAIGDEDYCRFCGPCGEGQGGCDGDAGCAGGLFCFDGIGPLYGLPEGTGVCDFNDIAYVEPQGVCGGGMNPCYSSIQEAVDDAFESGRIKVAAGAYDEAVTAGKAGVRLEFTWDGAFTTLAQPGAVILRGTTPP